MATHLSPLDLRLKVIAVALEPALTLARMVALPMDDLQKLVATGYFREAKRRKLSHRTIARRFGKSLRTIATLAKETDETVVPTHSEQIEQLRRVIEVLGDGPSDLGELRARVPSSSIPLDETIERLVDASLVRVEADEISLATNHVNLRGDEATQRLDSLRHFLGAVTKTIYARFFATDDIESFARVLTFSARSDGLQELRTQSYEILRDAVIREDALATEGEGATRQVSLALCFTESPEDHHWRDRSTG